MMESISYKNYKIYCLEGEKSLLDLGRDIVDGNIEVFEEFKVTKRNYVAGVLHNNRKYVLKSPRNEHRIPQRKVQTLFKEGEALSTLKNVNKLIDMGFKEFVQPLMAIVKREKGMIVDSFLVMEYVEGRRPERDEITLIVDFGRRLHSAKCYHGDFNTSNFMMTEDGLKTIDTQGKSYSFGSYRKHYEVMTFARDLLVLKYGFDGEKLFNYNRDLFYYLAKLLKDFKNLSVVSMVKKQKKKLRDRGWKI